MTELNHTQQQEQFKVLLIGDSCTDEYKIGTVDRLSPEAPVPVVKIVDSYTIPGMAANVYTNLVALGIEPDFVTNMEPITKTRYIDKRSGQHLLRVDSDGELRQWSGRTGFPLQEYDAIVISDYDKGFLKYIDIEQIVDSVRCPVFIDTKKKDLAEIAPPFRADHVYIKINELEFKNAHSISDNLIVTLGDRGAQYNGQIYPTKQSEVMDVCGCGDTFLAALAVQYLFTKDIEKAIMFANVAAGLTVQHRGNYAPSYDEIRNAGY
jgi:D-beta-D-heptose 7-phosphate kinase/D-beta-D-heptose 1-phosphate adenosyltransferase